MNPPFAHAKHGSTRIKNLNILCNRSTFRDMERRIKFSEAQLEPPSRQYYTQSHLHAFIFLYGSGRSIFFDISLRLSISKTVGCLLPISQSIRTLRAKRPFTEAQDNRLLPHGLLNGNGLVNDAPFEKFWHSSFAQMLSLRWSCSRVSKVTSCTELEIVLLAGVASGNCKSSREKRSYAGSRGEPSTTRIVLDSRFAFDRTHFTLVNQRAPGLLH